MEKNRPLGVTIIAITDIIIGIVGVPFLVYGLWSFLMVFSGQPEATIYLIFSIPFILGGAIGIILIMSGIWKLKLKDRGRKFNLYLSPFVAVAAYCAFIFIIQGITLSYSLAKELSFLISLFYFISHIWYLTHPKVRALFSPCKL